MAQEMGQGKGNDREVRQRLLNASVDLFGRKGYAATSVREIVAAAEVTPPVLYYYFGSKEGLFLELMRGPYERFDAELDGIRLAGREGGARERIRDLCLRVYRLFRENIGVARVMYSVYYGPPQGAPYMDFDAYHEKFRAAVLELVEEGVHSGQFRAGDLDAMTWAVTGAINVAVEVELCHPDRCLGEEGLANVLEIIFRGLSVCPGEEGKESS